MVPLDPPSLRALVDVDVPLLNQDTTGSAGSLDGAVVGTGPGNIVALDGSSRLPAVDGSLLTNLPAPGSVVYAAEVSMIAGSVTVVTAACYEPYGGGGLA